MKFRPVLPRSIANRDVDEAINQHLGEGAEQAALGFIQALEDAYTHIGHHPATGYQHYAYELDLPGLRFWPLKRYPCLVFYVLRDDHVDVWRVLHSRRDIPAWMVQQSDI